jgi:predicted nucleic acid-binding protein
MADGIERCYLDTSLLTAATISIEHHDAAEAFCHQLVASDALVYISDLVRLEYLQAVRRLQEAVDAATRQEFQLQLWGTRPEVRRRWIDANVRQRDSLLDQFSQVREISVDSELVAEAQTLMATCNLESCDAAHVAACLAAGVPDLAAIDRHVARASQLLRIHIVRDPVTPLPTAT